MKNNENFDWCCQWSEDLQKKKNWKSKFNSKMICSTSSRRKPGWRFTAGSTFVRVGKGPSVSWEARVGRWPFQGVCWAGDRPPSGFSNSFIYERVARVSWQRRWGGFWSVAWKKAPVWSLASADVRVLGARKYAFGRWMSSKSNSVQY